MDMDTLLFFGRLPQALPLYEALERKMRATLNPFVKKVQKTQISFYNRFGFASVSLPIRKIKGWPGVHIIVTFGLDHRLESPRIAEASEPYPRRWTHHIPLQDEAEIDEELMNWLRSAYEFSMTK